VQTVEGIGDRPAGIALAGGDLWVYSRRQPSLTRVDAATGKERRQHPRVGKDASAIVGDGDDVWVALSDDQEIVRVDARSGKVRDRWPVPGAPRRLAVNKDGVWVGLAPPGAGPGRLMHYDRSGRLLQNMPVDEGIGALLATDDAVWLVKRDSRVLSRLKRGSSTWTDWAELPGDVRTLRAGQGAVWAVLDQDDTVVRVDERGGHMVTSSIGRSPTQVEVAGDEVFVASRNDHTVVPLDPEKMLPAGAPIHVGLNPLAMVADDHAVWVVAVGDNSLTRIDYR